MILPLSSTTSAFRSPGSSSRMVIVPVEGSKPTMRVKKSSLPPVRKRTHFPTRYCGSWPCRDPSTNSFDPLGLSSVTVDVSSSPPTLAPWAKEVASAEASTWMRLRLRTRSSSPPARIPQAEALAMASASASVSPSSYSDMAVAVTVDSDVARSSPRL